MFLLHKSGLFMRQWQEHAQSYKECAGLPVAERFIVAVEEALHFIRSNPYACATYDPGEGNGDLRVHHYRKWSLKSFPYMLLFRIREKTIFVEALYAHKQDIASRFDHEFGRH